MFVESECTSTKEYLLIYIDQLLNVKHCAKNLAITRRVRYDYQHIKGEKLRLKEAECPHSS